MKISALPLDRFAKRVFKKISISILFVLSLFILSTNLVHAQSSTEESYNSTSYSSSNTYNLDPGVERNSHNAVQVILIDSLSALSCQLGGVDPTNPGGKCIGINKETGEMGYVENSGGVLLAIGKLIDMTFIPPASSMQYMAYLKNNFGIVKNTYAQTSSPCLRNNGANAPNGIGFCAIEPLLPVWVAMRNVVYLLFVLVFVIIGIGIMLRLHIDPRTVMTIQNQIPKIIIGILAITFSFAIAGLLIDIMWVTIYLFASVLTSATGIGTTSMINITQATDPFQAVNAGWRAQINPGADWPIFDIASRTATAFSDIVEGSLQTVNSQWGLGLLWNIFGGILDVVLTVILFIAIIILLIRLFITLLMAFINIILDIIFAPWWILAGLVPGSPIGLGAWIRDLIANLAVFPVTIAFMILGAYLIGAFSGNNTTASDYSGLNFPMLGTSSNGAAIGLLIGFGFILMLPNLLKTVKAALKAPNLSFGPMFGPVGGAAGVLTGSASRGWGAYRGYTSASKISGLPEFDKDGKYLGTPHARLSPTGVVKKFFGATPPGSKYK